MTYMYLTNILDAYYEKYENKKPVPDLVYDMLHYLHTSEEMSDMERLLEDPTSFSLPEEISLRKINSAVSRFAKEGSFLDNVKKNRINMDKLKMMIEEDILRLLESNYPKFKTLRPGEVLTDDLFILSNNKIKGSYIGPRLI